MDILTFSLILWFAGYLAMVLAFGGALIDDATDDEIYKVYGGVCLVGLIAWPLILTAFAVYGFKKAVKS